MRAAEDANHAAYANLLARSCVQVTGMDLSDDISADALYHAPFALVSHGIQPDPIFCYANKTAQELWQMDWQQFTQLPSRLSAMPDAQEDRQRLLEQAAQKGYIDQYEGVRVTADGRLFRIRNCLLWNVVSDSGVPVGQAARFSEWEWL